MIQCYRHLSAVRHLQIITVSKSNVLQCLINHHKQHTITADPEAEQWNALPLQEATPSLRIVLNTTIEWILISDLWYWWTWLNLRNPILCSFHRQWSLRQNGGKRGACPLSLSLYSSSSVSCQGNRYSNYWESHDGRHELVTDWLVVVRVLPSPN